MPYALGVDLGTTYSAAAVARNGRMEIFTLGTTAPAIPSVVVVRADGEVLVGETAERRSITEPTRTAREFKRRLGDPAPLILGGTPFGAESLMARVLTAIVAAVTEREGEPPAAITVTHPANYGPYKRDLLREMVRLADVGEVSFLTEPEAAAIEYARQNRVEPGETVAVYDFGGGTFDAAVLRKSADGFEILGTPEGMERLGGIDFDQAVFQHVDDATGGQLSELDTSDPQTRAALARLRADVRAAKESLSSDTDVTIPVMLPTVQTQVRLTRAEFEHMIRPRIADTIAAFQRAVRSAGIETSHLSRILLVGGSSRIPLVAEMVREATSRPVVVDAHPKFAIALGASWHGATALADSASEETRPIAATVIPGAAADVPTTVMNPPSPGPVASGGAGASAAATREQRPTATDDRRSRSPLLFVGAGLVVLAVLAGAAFLMFGNNAGLPPPTGTPFAGVRDSGLQSPGDRTPGTETEAPAPGTAATGPVTTDGRPTDVPATGPPATDAPATAPASPVATTAATDAGATPAAPVAGLVSQVAPDTPFGVVGGLAVADGDRLLVFDQSGTLRGVDPAGTVEQLGTYSELVGAGQFEVEVDTTAEGTVIAISPARNQLFEIGADGTATRIAGREDGQPGSEGAAGPADSAEFWAPAGVAVGPDGSIYVSDYSNNRIQRIDPDGTIATVVGGGPGTGAFGGDGGPAGAAQINGPYALDVDGEGRIFFVDVGNNRIRRIDSDGTITTVLGTGEDVARAPADAAPAIEQPITRNTEALAVDPAGNLYTYIEGFVVRVGADGTMDVLVGGGDDLNAVGVAPDRIRLQRVKALEVDPSSGDLYIADLSRVLVLPAVGEVE